MLLNMWREYKLGKKLHDSRPHQTHNSYLQSLHVPKMHDSFQLLAMCLQLVDKGYCIDAQYLRISVVAVILKANEIEGIFLSTPMFHLVRTVKPVYKDHLRGQVIVVFVGRWSLYRGACISIIEVAYETASSGHYRQVAFVYRWFHGKFHCILSLQYYLMS